MFKFTGIRGAVGKKLIANALGTFEKAGKSLEEGIAHCQADSNKHQLAISASQTKIRELGTHIERANRVVAKIKEFVA